MAAKKKAGESTAPNSKSDSSSKDFSRLAENTSKIVIQAIEILEEEVARGIVTAKRVEEKLTDVDKIRSGTLINNQKLDELLVRIRKDAHDIVDMVIDVAAIAVENIDKLSTDLIKANKDVVKG